MKTKSVILISAFVLLHIIQVILAVITASYSCKPGGEIYFITGLICLLGNFLIPFFHTSIHVWKRIVMACLLSLLSAIMWVVFFVVTDHKVICKLF
ncbi:MAG: hypothetical protein Q8M29_00100 [Bacteroidota bacterium]|nr:hypothetical protein [Bacteroidota bacterium]